MKQIHGKIKVNSIERQMTPAELLIEEILKPKLPIRKLTIDSDDGNNKNLEVT